MARVARQRSTTESLLSIVLALEAVLVFFVTLVVYGLKSIDPGLAFGGGAVLFVLLLLVGRTVRYPAGFVAGFVLQALIIATGILVPLMWAIGALFAGIWIFCFIRGRSIDQQKAAYLAQNAQQEGELA